MDLAERLWKLETRELKILASMLYPVDAFDMEKARQWVNEIPNQEIREQVCMNLFQRLEFADKLVEEWTGSDNGEVRATGYWLFARLLIIRSELVNQIDPYAIMEKMVADLESGSYFLRLSAQRALTFLGRSSATFSQKILAAIQDFNSSDDIVKNEIFESLNFEFTNFPG